MNDEFLQAQLNEAQQVHRYIQAHLAQVREVAQLLIEALRGGHHLLLCGNGGSALEAQHFAAELVGHYRAERDPLPALSLTSDGGILTAIANDYDYDAIFARQVRGYGSENDVLIAFSTSGNSGNVLAALDVAHQMGMRTIGVGGHDGGRMRDRCDTGFFLPFTDTARIQEAHLLLIHLLSEFLDEAFAPQ